MRIAALATVGTRIGAAAASFALTVVLTRSLPVAEFGIFAVALAWVNLAAVLVNLGHEAHATRTVAVLSQAADTHELAKLIRHWNFRVLCGGVVAIGLASLASGLGVAGPSVQTNLVYGAVFASLLAWIRLSQGVIRGFHRPIVSMMPDGWIRPFVSIALILWFHVSLGSGLDLRAAWGSMIVGALAALLVALVVQERALRQCYGTDSHSVELDTLAKNRFPIALTINALITVAFNQAALIIAGIFLPSEQAAMYAAGERIATATSLIAQALFLSVQAQISLDYAKKDLTNLTDRLRKATRLAATLTLIPVAFMVIFSDQILMIFGREYQDASSVLLILLAVTLLNAAAGPLGSLLIMTGRELLNLYAMVIAVCVLVGCAVLLESFGAKGLAVAMVIATLAWNSVMAIAVHRNLKFPLIFLIARK